MNNDKNGFLTMTDISKRFGGIQALKHVDLELNKGEVFALVGENGAGKSTLMNILGGVVQKDSGTIYFDGAIFEPDTPKDAQQHGISFIHQELTLFPSLTVTENIFVGSYPNSSGVINHKTANKEADEILCKLGISVNVKSLVRDLSIGDRQLVEIAKAVSKPVKLIIFDEPTSSLSKSEKDALFAVIRGLQAEGATIIYISHFLEEVLEISDRIMVMRDGSKVGNLVTAHTNEDQIIQMMVGRELRSSLTRTKSASSHEVLSVKNLSRSGYLEDINFYLLKGEILGIWGLLGSGRTELARSIFGLDPVDEGRILLEGKSITEKSPNEIRKSGIGYLTENRRDDGLILEMTVRENVSLASLEKSSSVPFGRIIRNKEKETTSEQIEKLRIVTSGTEQAVKNLSGGNQQKVVLAKWLAVQPRVYILDEPTRGVDVGAKEEIHRIILALAEDGASVVLISSEMEEILRLSDRILVMHKGKIRGEVSPEDATQENLVKYTTLGD